ncbi:putative leucine-rich repeat-containing protein DDB_G0290503 isoform X2 [Gambusia affinis]|uniref:putative leucine-rich repeat-containing protein DDB_G0290503 isoform X2 n=1 Tax=Gambusia affinis TaxID=33528 RepID=UPI001CDD7B58|nr:putative leucine-rich repeat-containing protein DDB_G0290503 isoform X2 [Gambusia affinis]
MEMSLKEFLAAVSQSLPVSTDHFVQEFLQVLHQDSFSCVVPVGVAATFVSVLSAVFVAYRWNRTPNRSSSELQDAVGKNNKRDVCVQTVEEGDAPCTVGGKETEKTHAMKTNPRSQVSLGQLRSVVTTTWINKLEERLKQSDVLQKQLENELETARRDLEIGCQQIGRKLMQKDEEVNKINQKLKKMTEEYNKQQSLLQESKREAKSLVQENQDLEKQLSEVRKDDVKQSEAEVLQQLKSEQLKREEAEKSLQELKTELDTKTQKLESLSKKVEILHETMKKTEESQQVLMKELENHKNQQKETDPERSAAVEESNLENISEITELRKELTDAQVQTEALTERNQQLEAQLADLKGRYYQEFKAIISEEREWREELDRDLKVLRKEYENKNNKLRGIQKEAEWKTSEDVSAPAEEEEIHEEDS